MLTSSCRFGPLATLFNGACIVGRTSFSNMENIRLLNFSNLRWYQRLEIKIRQDWALLSSTLEEECRVEPKGAENPNRFFTKLCNLRQGREPIAQYITKAEESYIENVL